MRAVILLVVSCFLLAAPADGQGTRLTPAQWREDIDFVVHTLEREHPMPFARVDEATFRAAARELRANAARQSAEQNTVGLMRLVGMLEDGHTALDPSLTAFGGAWLPVRFYQFSDGVYISAAGATYADIVGARVLSIGGTDAETAIAGVEALMGADNEFGARENLYWASNAAALRGLGYAPDGLLRMSVVDVSGQSRDVTIEPIEGRANFDWRFWGEMYTPLADDVGAVGWGGHPTADFRTGDAALPLFLRDQRPFHVALLEGQNIVYFQFNYVTRTAGSDSFEAAYHRVLDALDANPARRLVLDIRYNFGGNGAILMPFVHELIRRPQLSESGRFIVITGRQTFSAGANLLTLLVEHLDPVLVGEPAGAGYNAFGNPETFTLPNSGMELLVSSALHVGKGWTEQIGQDERIIRVDFPALMSGADYFAGRDPAMALVLSGADLRSLEAIAEHADAETLRRSYAARRVEYGSIPWWRATDMWSMNSAGNALRRAGERADDPVLIERAITALTINAEVYPEWWNSWDSLAEANLAAGHTEIAIAYYERSLELNPGNGNASAMIGRIRD